MYKINKLAVDTVRYEANESLGKTSHPGYYVLIQSNRENQSIVKSNRDVLQPEIGGGRNTGFTFR